MNNRHPERESLLSIGRKWLPWCMALIFAITIGWTVLVAWHEIHYGMHENAAKLAVAIGKDAAATQPLIVVYAIFTVTILDLSGGGIVVTYRYLSDKFLEPQREKIRAKVRAEVRAEALKEGETARQILWEAWNNRREEAEKNGVPFDEPPPGR